MESRADIVAKNDALRSRFIGGRVEFIHGPYEIEPRFVGRMLCALMRYNKFHPDSLHDEGVMLFAGFDVCWRIEVENGERVLRVWVNADVLQGA